MGMLANRLRKNLQHLRKWAQRERVSCYRLYDHDIPEYPLTLDDYEGRLFAVVRREIADLESEIGEVLDFPLVVRSAPSHHIDFTRSFLVHESGLRFEVNLHGHKDTGLFLDHRKLRQWVRANAAKKRVLNLFCYTGSFSVYAAAGGASHVTSVDLSKTYLDWAGRNFSHNRLPPGELLQGDVLQWLERCRDSYDLIVCDPPTFSNSKRMQGTFEVQRDHGWLLEICSQRLNAGGILLFSLNDRGFRIGNFPGLKETTAQTTSEDFRRRGAHRSWRWVRTEDMPVLKEAPRAAEPGRLPLRS